MLFRSHGLALNITVQTYAGRVDFGIVADKKALPHANDLAKAIEAAFIEASKLMGPDLGSTELTVSATKTAKADPTNPPVKKSGLKSATLGSKSAAAKSPRQTTHGKTVVKKPLKRAVSV